MGTFSKIMQIHKWSQTIDFIDQAEDTICQLLNGNLELTNEAFDLLYDNLALSYYRLRTLHQDFQHNIAMEESRYLGEIAFILLMQNSAEKNCPAEMCAQELSTDIQIIRQAYKIIEKKPNTYKCELLRLFHQRILASCDI